MLSVQLLGIVTVTAWTAATSYLFLKAIDLTVGLRVSVADELLGADYVMHGLITGQMIATNGVAGVCVAGVGAPAGVRHAHTQTDSTSSPPPTATRPFARGSVVRRRSCDAVATGSRVSGAFAPAPYATNARRTFTVSDAGTPVSASFVRRASDAAISLSFAEMERRYGRPSRHQVVAYGPNGVQTRTDVADFHVIVECREDTPLAGEDTPRAGEATPRAGEGTPRAGEGTPRAGEGTPRAGEATPRAGEDTPLSGEATPRAGEDTPHAGEATPRAGAATSHHSNGATIGHSNGDSDGDIVNRTEVNRGDEVTALNTTTRGAMTSRVDCSYACGSRQVSTLGGHFRCSLEANGDDATETAIGTHASPTERYGSPGVSGVNNAAYVAEAANRVTSDPEPSDDWCRQTKL